MKELNIRSFGELVYVVLRKEEWLAAFAVSLAPSKEDFFDMGSDEWLPVGSSSNFCTILLLLAKILGKSFTKVEDDKNRVLFVRNDCLESFKELVQETKILLKPR